MKSEGSDWAKVPSRWHSFKPAAPRTSETAEGRDRNQGRRQDPETGWEPSFPQGDVSQTGHLRAAEPRGEGLEVACPAEGSAGPCLGVPG